MSDYSKLLNFTWSTSKADTCAQCIHKFRRVYGDGHKESSHALTLGTDTHDIIANEIISRNTDLDKLIAKMDDMGGCDPELYNMAPAITDFVEKWVKMSGDLHLEATIEKKYAMDREGKSVDFFSKDAYIRGVFDMHWYNEQKRQLYVLDHKTSKALSSKNAVKEHAQLNLYVWMLTRLFNIQWDSAHIALHFVRHGKIVWASLTPEDTEVFGRKYMHFLSILEDRITKAYETDNWEKSEGFHCKWCSFREECKSL